MTNENADVPFWQTVPPMVRLFAEGFDPDPPAPDVAEYGFVKFQHGPIAEVGVTGTTIENVARLLVDRLERFQAGPFACPENAEAIECFRDGIAALEARTAARQAQGVEGTDQTHVPAAPVELLCGVEGCERNEAGKGYSREQDLVRHVNAVHGQGGN